MMNESEREYALKRMREASNRFYSAAVQIGCHPFIEFTGLLNAYIDSCQAAHREGIDFTECNRHAGKELPLEQHQIAYMAEKLECIFGDRLLVGQAVRPTAQG